MNNNKIDLYNDLHLDSYYWGGALNITTKVDISSKSDLINALDKVCKNEDLTALGEDWNEINYDEFKHLLTSALQFNLGFAGHRVMSEEKAHDNFEALTTGFDINTSRCFTNCFNHFWDDKNKGYSSNSISKHTIDLAIAILNEDKILFTYFLFED
jgi:hypothetical protein